MRAVEGFAKGAGLVGPGDEKVEESDDSAFEFFATTCIDCGWGESAPDDRFTDAGCDEERDTAAEAIAFLQELVQEDDN